MIRTESQLLISGVWKMRRTLSTLLTSHKCQHWHQYQNCYQMIAFIDCIPVAIHIIETLLRTWAPCWKFMWKPDWKANGDSTIATSNFFLAGSVFNKIHFLFKTETCPLGLGFPYWWNPSVLWVNKIHKRFLCGTNTDKTPNGHITLLQSMGRQFPGNSQIFSATTTFFFTVHPALRHTEWKQPLDWGIQDTATL